jgi:mannose/fructose/N-acetylgalactosamine-specific phosphotransferase system component IID
MMNQGREKINRLKMVDLIGMFFRSFLIQASWNYRGMLNLGFLFTIMPGLKRLYTKREDRIDAAERHFGFFNTHPYLASYAIGATLSAEEESLGEGETSIDDVIRLKRSLCGPLGALGDNLFWSRWRPMCALIGVLGAYLWGIWGPVVFLIIYNIPHILVRYWGLHSSYRDRISFVNELSGPVYRSAPALGERMGSFFVGCLVVIFVGYHGSFSLATRIVFLASLLVTVFLMKRFKSFRILHSTIVILLVTISLFGVSSWLR